MPPFKEFEFAIDRGGTFTDIYCQIKDHSIQIQDDLYHPQEQKEQNNELPLRDKIPKTSEIILKLPSEAPSLYLDPALEGIRRIIFQQMCFDGFVKNKSAFSLSTENYPPADDSFEIPDDYKIAQIRLGTTIATNAFLEGKGSKVLLLVTKGFKDILVIGNQSRPSLFELAIGPQSIIYERVIEVPERVIVQPKSDSDFYFDDHLYIDCPTSSTTSGKTIKVIQPIDMQSIKTQLEYYHYQEGFTNVAISFLHGHIFPDHEKMVVECASAIGYQWIFCGSQIQPIIKYYERTCATLMEAYLTPILRNYLNSFSSNLSRFLQPKTSNPRKNNENDPLILIMGSDGGLIPSSAASGLKAVLSGPAGGMYGICRSINESPMNLAESTQDENSKAQIIGIDMGGTSADVSRVVGSKMTTTLDTWFKPMEYNHLDLQYLGAHSIVNDKKKQWFVTGGAIPLRVPMLEIQTVAAGGGSICTISDSLLTVGPKSSGSNPGPACYGKDGPLSLTDCNMILGRLYTAFFPKIFGKSCNQSIIRDLSMQSMKYLKKSSGSSFTEEQLAHGFLKVSVESMAKTIRSITLNKGLDPSKHTLFPFGGVGGQLACPLAEALNISKIVFSKYGSILSAFGISNAPITKEIIATVNIVLSNTETDQSIQKDPDQMAIYWRNEFLPFLIKQVESCYDKMVLEWSQLFKHKSFKIDETAGFEIIFQCTLEGSFTLFPIEFHTYLESMPSKTYKGTLRNLICLIEGSSQEISSLIKEIKQEFYQKMKFEFGFDQSHRQINVDQVRVIGRLDQKQTAINETYSPIKLKPLDRVNLYNEKRSNILESVPVYSLDDIFKSEFSNSPKIPKILGPCLLVDNHNTLVLDEGWSISSHTSTILVLIKESTSEFKSIIEPKSDIMKMPDPLTSQILLSVYSHRFMSIATNMGDVLARVSRSVNIRERLDFSCALFDPFGNLIANAPHIPVHLGSMGGAIKYQVKLWQLLKSKKIQSGWNDGVKELVGLYGENFFAFDYDDNPNVPNDNSFTFESDELLQNGDFILTNHPVAGGTHLPDLTVIMPVFKKISKSGGVLLFWVASRGHHSDIGARVPGSMPSNSRILSEEGVAIYSYMMASKGIFNEKEIRNLFKSSRNLEDNISDLMAQMAANHRGSLWLLEWMDKEGWLNVIAAMRGLLLSAETATRNLLKNWSIFNSSQNSNLMTNERATNDSFHPVKAGQEEIIIFSDIDHMDDGSPITVMIALDRKHGNVLIDFSKSGYSVFGNWNTPKAIVFSAVLYVFRCLLSRLQNPDQNVNVCQSNEQLPLNSGSLRPVKILLPGDQLHDEDKEFTRLQDCIKKKAGLPKIRQTSLLNPPFNAAVVSGNVLTSQRIADLLLKALGIMANSQGCTNNVSFGNSKFGYYETIGGGNGAGLGWNGRSAVQVHMTNTKMTDPEIMEEYYPIIIHELSVRPHSGGIGKWNGGHGIIKHFEFRVPKYLNESNSNSDWILSVLSERRALPPGGIYGGQDGSRGLNLLLRYSNFNDWIRQNSHVATSPKDLIIRYLRLDKVDIFSKRNDQTEEQSTTNFDFIRHGEYSSRMPWINLGGKCEVFLNPGDRFVLMSPGGGGWGHQVEN